MYFAEKVLITRTGKFKEYDLWVRFLTPQRGVLTGFAFGGCRSRRRFCGCLDPLNLVLFKVNSSPGNKYLTLEEGSLICGYPELKKNQAKLGMAVNSLRFVQKICLEGDDSAQLYNLTIDYLQTLEDIPEAPVFLPLLFRAKACFIHGFGPSIDSCRDCGKQLINIADPFFLYAQGRMACPGCMSKAYRGIKVRRDSLLFMNRLRETRPYEWAQWSLSNDLLKDCYQIVEALVGFHIE
ncbi:DNA repair protein RecO [Desulfonatronovibrio magnus]|uniref:DNA repair protein RecO n=1 Tax=Desulfonatronovibrio magnus TaxID=698827 RepID=UPI0005EB5584|nr:DNA repair protein RecO [Desulfonatronovibrio magnus]RQD65578.1 MAG: DNA repair protein RecO [Desulfonatronovibrio sp. MSAO_Bac4]